MMLKTATAMADFYLANSCADGIPMGHRRSDLVRLDVIYNRPLITSNRWTVPPRYCGTS
jgi:hypothetical protein